MLHLSHLSNVMPFPTMATGGEVNSPPRYSTSKNLSSSREPWDTERKAPIFCDFAQALSLQRPHQECYNTNLDKSELTTERLVDTLIRCLHAQLYVETRPPIIWTGLSCFVLVETSLDRHKTYGAKICFEYGCHMFVVVF